MRRPILLALLVAAPATLLAQTSQFGMNGLGLPGRHASARAAGSAGAFGYFDPVSSANPASVLEQTVMTASFTGLQNYRSSTNLAGSETGRSTRFPQLMIGGPLRRLPLALAASFSTYTDRDFALASGDTVVLRGTPVAAFDTLTSSGGVSDLRLAGAYRLSGWALGAGMHVVTGSTRNQLHRTFEDSAYAPINQRAEVSYAGIGFSAGVTGAVARAVVVAATVRVNSPVKVNRDSTRVAEVSLPVSLGASLRWRPAPRLDLAVGATTSRWSTADADLRALGGTGARNTFEVSGGGEFIRNVRRPFQRPVRFGVRYATLPFPVESGAQAHELGFALGSGIRFAQDRAGIDHAGIDLSLERLWRRASGGYSEGAWLVSVGVMVRP